MVTNAKDVTTNGLKEWIKSLQSARSVRVHIGIFPGRRETNDEQNINTI